METELSILDNGMDKMLLEELINDNLSTREIAERTGKSQTTIRWWLKKHSLKTAINFRNRGGFAGKPKSPRDGRQFLCYCKRCGETDPTKFYVTARMWTRCISCHTKANVRRYKRNKKTAVEYKGGKCSICGYDKCLASLDFHHVDPTEKDPNWRRMRGWKFEKIKEELDKCVLVCRNCHGEIHSPD